MLGQRLSGRVIWLMPLDLCFNMALLMGSLLGIQPERGQDDLQLF